MTSKIFPRDRLDYLDTVVRYLRVVLTRDLEAQIQTLETWSDPAFKKAGAIHELLVFLFSTEVLGVRRVTQVMKGISQSDRAWIASEMRQRADVARLSPRDFWQSAVDFWAPQGSDLTHPALIAKAIQFDALLNTARLEYPGTGASSAHRRPGPSQPCDLVTHNQLRASRSRSQPPRQSTTEPKSFYLTKAQVQQLWEASSFLVQEHGELLNTRLVVSHDRLGISDPDDATQLISDLTHELGMALRRWSGSSHRGFHFLYVHEPYSAPESGFRTVLAAVIPDRYADEAQHWLSERFLLKRFGGSREPKAVRMTILQSRNAKRRLQRHLQLVRMLCRMVDPSLQVLDRGQRRTLEEVMGLPQKVALDLPGGLGLTRRFAVSRTMSTHAQSTIKAAKLSPLSAFADGAWSYLDTGWELREHEDRTREKQDRRAAEASIRAQWSSIGGILSERRQQDALEQLWASWPEDPKQRLRSWIGWWV